MRKSEVRFPRFGVVLAAAFLLLATMAPSPARADTFEAGSLIIPMDLTYQDYGVLQAYGLVAMLLRHGIPVRWVIETNKTHTNSPDFTAVPKIVYDNSEHHAPGEVLLPVRYRSGPFVIAAADAARAREIIDVWNRPKLWGAHPWAARSVFQVVTVHEATAPFYGVVQRLLIHPPRPGILADSREAEYARILRAAGIFQSNGAEFTDEPCLPGGCGPGTARPELLPDTALMADASPCYFDYGTAMGPHYAATTLFDAHLRPRFALVAAAGWTADDREAVVCEGGVDCTGTILEDAQFPYVCFTPPLLVHGHRIVNHLTVFAQNGGGLFFMGEAAYALENAVADAFGPWYDRSALGHFFTATPQPIPCPCEDPSQICARAGCHNLDGVAVPCCLAVFPPSRGAGILPGGQSDGALSILSPSHPAFQLLGELRPSVGGLGLFSPVTLQGAEVVMTPDHAIADGPTPAVLASERVLLLADFRPGVALPISANPDTQVARLFLNALFASRWATPYGGPVAPQMDTGHSCFGPDDQLIHQVIFSIHTGTLPELEDVRLEVVVPEGISVEACSPPSETAAPVLTWSKAAATDMDLFICTFRHQDQGMYALELNLTYSNVGLEQEVTSVAEQYIGYELDSDGDGMIDCEDPDPHAPPPCGDANGDWYDDCSGEFLYDDDEGCCDCGDYPVDKGDDPLGFPCAAAAGRRVHPRATISALLMLLGLLALRRRRRS